MRAMMPARRFEEKRTPMMTIIDCADACAESSGDEFAAPATVSRGRPRGAELKSSFIFDGSKLAHFNFVGDSVLGQDVNLEAGSIVCNYRNERADKTVYVRVGEQLHSTGLEKFGGLLGDHTRIGANAVLAPGAVLMAHTVIPRMTLHDLQ